MNLTFLLIILLLIVAFVVLFKVLKSMFKAAITVISFAIVLFLIITAIVIVDGRDFKNSLETTNTTFVLVDNGNVLNSFRIDSFNFSKVRYIDVNNISSFEFEDKRVFFVNPKAIVTYDIQLENKEIFSYDLIGEIKNSNNLTYNTNLFSSAIRINVQKEGISYLLLKLRNEEIFLKKETMFVKFVKFLPEFLFKIQKKIYSTNDSVKEKADDFSQMINKTKTTIDSITDKIPKINKDENSTDNITEDNIENISENNFNNSLNETIYNLNESNLNETNLNESEI